MNNNKLIITPQTKVGELLDAYPLLEQPLVEMAPEFKKLKNPILRKTIAKVASLQQAAALGGLQVDTLVNSLRKLAGQDDLAIVEEQPEYLKDAPGWFNEKKIAIRFDARQIIAGGGHPLGDVIRELHGMDDGGIFELTTPFLPAPLIDKVSDMGYNYWSNQEQPDLFRTYFKKK